MKSNKKTILKQIRQSLQRDELSFLQKQHCQEHILKHPRGLFSQQPINDDERINLFITAAQEAHANITQVINLADIPRIILQAAQEFSLPLTLCMSTDEVLHSLPWHLHPEIILKKNVGKNNDVISLTVCLCGVAETGTLVLLADANSPISLNFLPSIHFVLLAKNNIVSHYEDAWDLIRDKKVLPRSIHFITGPSRTADIEQTLQLGMHGPKQLYILLYDKDENA